MVSQSVYEGLGERGGTYGGAGAADPARQNILTGSEDIDDAAVVRETGAGVGPGAGADSAGRRGGGRRIVGSVGVVVAGGDGKEHTGVGDGGGSAVDGGGETTTERHVGNGAGGAAPGARVGHDEVHAGDDARAVREGDMLIQRPRFLRIH